MNKRIEEKKEHAHLLRKRLEFEFMAEINLYFGIQLHKEKNEDVKNLYVSIKL